MPLQNKVKEFRTTKKLTQLELSKLLEISPRTLSLIESDDYNLSTILAIKIAKIFEVPVENIFNIEEDKEIEEKISVKDNIKKYIKRIVLLYLGLFVGMIVIQVTLKIIGYTGADLIENLRYFLIQNAQWFYIANFILLFFGILFFMQGKKLVSKIGDENDEIYDKADEKLDASIHCINIFFALPFVFFAAAESGSHNVVGIFLFQVVSGAIIQYLAVEQVKKLAPNRKGNAFTQKKWLDSQDERVKQIMGAAALKSMITMQIAMVILLCASIILSLIMDTLFIAIVIGILWIVQNQSFMNMGRKLEKRK